MAGADAAAAVEQKASWLPLIVVVMTQIQASFAVNALTVSMAGITTDLDTPATSVGTAITAGTFAMAAFILLGAKVGAKVRSSPSSSTRCSLPRRSSSRATSAPGAGSCTI